MLNKSFVIFSLLSLCIVSPRPGAVAQTTSSQEARQRIISLNGSNTELLFALGVGDQVAGRDDSAIFPPEALKIPSIGYQYQLNAEGVLSLTPTLVIGKTDVRPPVVVEQIKASGVRVELLKEPGSLDEVAGRITALGNIVNRSEAAAKLVTQFQSDMKKFTERKAELGNKTRKKAVFLYFRGPKNAFVLGGETGPGRMLALVGAENVLASVGRTAPITAEALIAAQPEVIVTFTHGIESLGGVDALKDVPGVMHTPAGKNGRFVIMDDLYLSGFTHRAGRAALDLMNALQGEGITEVTGR